MNISINATQFDTFPQSSRDQVEEKLQPLARLLSADEATALLEVELAPAPAEGRSASPTRLAATLSFGGHVVHAEAVKPTPEAAADRVRATLEHEVRNVRGKGESRWRKGAARVKNMLRFGN